MEKDLSNICKSESGEDDKTTLTAHICHRTSVLSSHNLHYNTKGKASKRCQTNVHPVTATTSSCLKYLR